LEKNFPKRNRTQGADEKKTGKNKEKQIKT
jgi:hypothetical protein